MINPDSLGASEEVRLSCYCVEESSVDLVFGQTRAQVAQALRGVLFHARLTENPVPVPWRGWKTKIRRREIVNGKALKEIKDLMVSMVSK